MHLDSLDPPHPGGRADPPIDDLARALETDPRWAGAVLRAERRRAAHAIWDLTARPAREHAAALRDLAQALSPHDPTAIDPLCAAYRRALLRWRARAA